MPRTDDFTLIEILLGVGRSVKIKRSILDVTMAQLAKGGLNPEHVMVVLQDLPWEDVSPSGGRLPHA